MARHQFAKLSCGILVLLLVACDEPTEPKRPALTPSIIVPTLNLSRWSEARFAIVRDATRQLAQATEQFLAEPSDETRTSLQNTWRNAHDRYLEITLLNSGHSDHRIDAWPTAPGFIDSLPGYPSSGMINDDTISIDQQTVLQQHQITDDSEVVLGFHTIEYYAFERPIEDFLEAADNSDRRRQLLALVAAQLTEDIAAMTADVSEAMLDLGYADVVSALIPRVKNLIEEFAEWQDHSPFSGDSYANISGQIRLIEILLSGETGLSHYFVDLDGDKAMALQKTLTQLTSLTASPSSTLENADEIRLLLSGLVHQLEDVSSLAQLIGNQ